MLFFPSPATIFFLSSSLAGPFVKFWCFFLKRRCPEICTCGLSGCRVKPRRLQSRRSFTRQPENSKRAHLRVPPRLHKNHQNSTNLERERGKKERNFGRSGAGRSGVGRSGVGRSGGRIQTPFGLKGSNRPPFSFTGGFKPTLPFVSKEGVGWGLKGRGEEEEGVQTNPPLVPSLV